MFLRDFKKFFEKTTIGTHKFIIMIVMIIFGLERCRAKVFPKVVYHKTWIERTRFEK